MQISLNWLREFIEIEEPVQKISHALTMTGLEIEGVEHQGDDHILEVNVTPNRPDCLSVLGTVRELSAIYRKPLKWPDYSLNTQKDSDFRIVIDDSGLCARYAGRIVRGITPGESPDWIKEKLKKCGIRSVNNIVDITNYVLIEMGHPLHAFDLATLRGKSIRVGVAGGKNSITTLDGVKRDLPADALLIWDAERPVAIAGVMGGAETEVTGSTTDIFIESAYFKPQSVRRTSKTLGLSTEASYRFERGTDIQGLETALDRTVHLILQVAGGTAENLIDEYPSKFKPLTIPVSVAKVNKVLGISLTSAETVELLGRLDLEISNATDERFEVIQPSFRPDLQKEWDIIEEVARIYGFLNIPTVRPKIELVSGANVKHSLIEELHVVLRNAGYHDAINYSFMNIKYLDILMLQQGDRRRQCVEVKNPLRQEDAHLRTMLLPSLLENYIYNVSRGARGVKLYEEARVFEKTNDPLPRETLMAGGILAADRSPSLYNDDTEEFYQVKGIIESIFDQLRISGYSLIPTSEPYLHPGKSADIIINKQKVGSLGAVSPEVLQALAIKTPHDIIVFELNLDKLVRHLPDPVTYARIPRHPSVQRDIAIVLDTKITAADVIRHIKAYETKFMEDVTVFDSYQGKHVPKNKKSLGFNILYRAPDRTLTDGEVDAIQSGLVTYLLKKTGGQLRT